MKSPASRALVKFMKTHGIGPTKASHDLGVTKTAVIQWMRGERVPNPVSRDAIEIWTHEAVKASDWKLGKVESAIAERAANVKPFEPAPAENDAGEEAEPTSEPRANGDHGSAA